MSAEGLLPFTQAQFFAAFEVYNAAIWPVPVIAYPLAAAAVGLASWRGAAAGRIVAALLAAAWLLMGGVYHGIYLAALTLAAYVYGAAFAVQAGLLLVEGSLRGRLVMRLRTDARGIAALVLILFAMGGYPALGALGGHGPPDGPLFGVAPCPTTIFTFGMLLLTDDRPPWRLSVVPSAWAVIGGSASLLLGVPQDAALPVAAVAALLLLRGAGPRPQTAR